ncbi:MAG TPA: TolC family protein [Casimicrobiaceae bacterium]|jgi:NodT family efflux transporter outer membrane factor (OMF) lipoprotein
MHRSPAIPAATLALLLAGCALGPPPKPDDIRAQSLPQFAVPAAWTGAPAAAGSPADNWLASFGDPRLDALVREAMQYNVDLLVAAARVEQAAGYAKAAGATIYPALNLLAHGGGKFGGDGSGLNGVGLFASWELDLWGRVRAQREVGRAQYEATVADVEFARQSIAAMVAKSWLLAIQARASRAIAADIVQSSEHSLSLAGDRLRIGRGDEYDVTLSQAYLETSRDAARQLALGEQQALRALEVLVGRYPAAAIDVPTSLPALQREVPAGVPSELLERRPDVIAAERRVDAAFYNVAEAKAARLPKISLTASVSSVDSSLFVLQSHSNPVASLGANLVWPLFNGYALEAQVDIRTAEQKLAIADYGRVASRAFSEVEGALSASVAADERETILARAVTSNARGVDLSQVRYNVGSGDLRAVLQQSIALYSARTTLLQAQTDRLVQRVNLHLALGGGFESPPRAGAADGDGGITGDALTKAAALQRSN